MDNQKKKISQGKKVNPIESLGARVAGFIDGTRTNIPPAGREILAKTKGISITNVAVGRKPLGTINQTLLSTLGNPRYDKYFHLYIIVTLTNGEEWVMEKNEDVSIRREEHSKEEEIREVGSPQAAIDMQGWLDNTRKLMGDENFYHYDGITNNCQVFADAELRANGLPSPTDFIFQDVHDLVGDVAHGAMNTITDWKNRFNILAEGWGAHGLPRKGSAAASGGASMPRKGEQRWSNKVYTVTGIDKYSVSLVDSQGNPAERTYRQHELLKVPANAHDVPDVFAKVAKEARRARRMTREHLDD